MRVLAAATWGINGTSFLLMWAMMAVAVFMLGWQLREQLLTAVEAGRAAWELEDYELATLHGGIALAVTAAAVQLQESGLLEPGAHRGSLRMGGRPAGHLDAFELEVLKAVGTVVGAEATLAAVRRRVAAGSAARELRHGLERDGLLLTPRRARLARATGLLELPAVGLGSVRLLSALSDGGSVGGLAVLLVALVAATLWFSRPRRTTQAGEEALETLREAHPDWRTEPRAINPSLAVALFGGRALWVVDPAIAGAMSLPRERAVNRFGAR